MQRNYQELSPFDFEELTRDLLQAELGGRFEIFPIGRDGGVDVRLMRNADTLAIAQCKHSPFKTFADIKSSLSKEAELVRSRNLPGMYYLATSASLTSGNKDDIVEMFGNERLTPERVWSRLDIDNLLNTHTAVEERHYKLYMAGADFLQRILTRDARFRRDTTLEELQEKVRLFVQTPALLEAQKRLLDSGVCIVSGAPGVGKTTLAEMLLLDFSEREYEVIVVTDVGDIEALYSPERKQLFYYDDFLGQNSVTEKLGRNEDGRLLSIINRIDREQPHRHLFILTTREYILTQAKQAYGRLARSDIDVFKYVLDLRSYNKFHRAHILYNHVYYSDLPTKALESLLYERKYRTVIDSSKYSPRLVEMAIRFARRKGPPANSNGFADYLIRMLREPTELWSDVFESQLGSIERDILYALISMTSRRTTLTALRKTAQSYAKLTRGTQHDYIEFHKALDVLDGVILRIISAPHDDERYIGFANPSFPDYLRAYLARNPQHFKELVESFVYFAQFDTIADWGWPSLRVRRRYVAPFMEDPIVVNRPSSRITGLDHLADGLARGLIRTIDSEAISPDDDFTFSTGYRPDGKVAPAVHLDRFARVAIFVKEAASHLTAATLALVLDHILERISEHSYWWPLNSDDRDRLIDIVSLLQVASSTHELSSEELLETAISRLESSLRGPKDYVSFDRLLEMSGQERSHIRQTFTESIDDFVDSILSLDAYESVDSERDELALAAEHFDLEIDDELARIQSYLEDLPPDYDGSDDDDDRRGWSRMEERETDSRIDSLFDSLRDVER